MGKKLKWFVIGAIVGSSLKNSSEKAKLERLEEEEKKRREKEEKLVIENQKPIIDDNVKSME